MLVMMVLMVTKMTMACLASTFWCWQWWCWCWKWWGWLMVTEMMMIYLASTLLTASLLLSRPAQSWESSALFTCHVIMMISDQSDKRWARWEWQQKNQSCSSQDLPTSILERIFTTMRMKIEHWRVNNLEAAHDKENIVTCKLRSCSWETISWWSTPAVGEPSSMWAAQLRRRRTRKIIGGIFSFSQWVVHTARKKLDYWRLSRACNDLILSMFNKSSLSLSLSNIVAIGYTRDVSLRKDVPFLHKYDNSRV